MKPKPCPNCGEVWIYVSDGDYCSGYEAKGFRMNCKCHYAWNKTDWCKTRKEAIDAWNRRANYDV